MFCSTCLHLLWIIMTMEMPNNACLELTSLNSLLWHFLHMVSGCNLRRKSIFNISWCKLFIIFSVWCDSTIDIWNWCCTKWRGRKRVGWIMRLIFEQNISNYSIKLIVQFISAGIITVSLLSSYHIWAGSWQEASRASLTKITASCWLLY